jgi:hypothetical protein
MTIVSSAPIVACLTAPKRDRHPSHHTELLCVFVISLVPYTETRPELALKADHRLKTAIETADTRTSISHSIPLGQYVDRASEADKVVQQQIVSLGAKESDCVVGGGSKVRGSRDRSYQ